MQATKLPSGSWRVQITVEGKRISVTRPTRREALKAAETKIGVREGHCTIGEAIEQFISDRENILSPYTITGYRTIQRCFFIEFQKERIINLTEQSFIQAVNEEAKRLSPKTIRNCVALIRSALKGKIDMSAWDIPLPQKKKSDIKIPTDDELNEILRIYEGDELETPVQLAAFCGLRRGEICAFDPRTDVHDGYVWINKAAVELPDGSVEIKPPKTEAGYRRVELPDFIHIDTTKDRLTTLTPKQMSNRFSKRMNFKFSFQSLRHYYCSNAMLEMPTKYVQKRMGHSTDNMTKNVYQHIVTQADRNYSEKMRQKWTAHELHTEK